VGGVDSLPLIEVEIQYPVQVDYSGICTERILVTVVDTLGAPLDPGNLFDRVGFRAPNGVVQYQQFVLTEAGAARFELGAGGLTINPGDTTSFTLVGDVAVGSAIDHFVLLLESETSLGLVDATDTSYSPSVVVSGDCGAGLPFVSLGTHVYQPAGRPDLATPSLPVQLGYRGQTGVVIFEADLSYEQPTLQGDLELLALTASLLKRSSSGLSRVAENSVFENVRLYADDSLLATDADLGDDSLMLVFDEAFRICQGERFTVRLEGDIKATAAVGNYVVRCEDSTFAVLEDANLGTSIFPALVASAYPVQSHELSILASGLEGSLTNYPNPFNPDEGPTTIGYVLTGPGRVDIDLFTITGDLVRRLVIDQARPEGPNQSDQWTGTNGVGQWVSPGTYFCRITVRYNGGNEETVTRKVSVVR
jgi:hypothetical protein